jgi:hypothetical protein
MAGPRGPLRPRFRLLLSKIGSLNVDLKFTRGARFAPLRAEITIVGTMAVVDSFSRAVTAESEKVEIVPA